MVNGAVFPLPLTIKLSIYLEERKNVRSRFTL